MSPPSKKQQPQSNKSFAIAGDVLNCTSLVLNVIMTSVAMLQLPSPSFFDPWWQSHGFICFLFLTTSAATAWFLLQSPGRLPSVQGNPQLAAKMNGSIFANAAHGGGHLFLFLLGGPPPALELEPTPAAIGNLIMLVCFWYGVLNNIVVSFSSRAALIASVVY
jgi:hypothetical protein